MLERSAPIFCGHSRDSWPAWVCIWVLWLYLGRDYKTRSLVAGILLCTANCWAPSSWSALKLLDGYHSPWVFQRRPLETNLNQYWEQNWPFKQKSAVLLSRGDEICNLLLRCFRVPSWDRTFPLRKATTVPYEDVRPELECDVILCPASSSGTYWWQLVP